MIKPFPQTLEEVKTMWDCVMAARKKKLKSQHIEWLLDDRQRCDFFEQVMDFGQPRS